MLMWIRVPSPRGARVVAASLSFIIALVAGAVGGHAQEGATVTGWVLDAASGEPVPEAVVRLESLGRRSVTDVDGRFNLPDLPQGVYVLSIDDPTFGAHTDLLEVPSSGVVAFTVRLGLDVFELEPLVVNVLGREEAVRRALGSPFYLITRADIEASIGGGLSPGDILRSRVPGITLDPGPSFGQVGCMEFRRPTSFLPGCQPPLVIVDGVRISAPSHFLDTTPLEHIESLTVLSATEATTLYGPGAFNGVIQVQMRRPGADRARPDAPTSAQAAWKAAYNWDLEPGGHPWFRSWGGATVGMLTGLAVAITAAGDCSPLNEARSQECRGNGRLAGAATFALPVMGGALGANLGGRTERSHGEMIMTGLAALMPMFAGYFFAVPQSAGPEFESQQIFGRAIVVVGLPVLAAAADRLFRTRR